MRRGLLADSLTRNSVSIMATTAANSILGFTFWTVVAHYLPTAEVGSGTALISAMICVSVLANSGASLVLVQRLPKRSDGREWSTSVAAAYAVGLSATAVLAVAAAVFLPTCAGGFHLLRGSPWVFTLFVLATMALSLGDVTDHVFIAERRSAFMLARNGMSNIARLLTLIGAVVLLDRVGASDLISIWGFSALVGSVVGFRLFVPRFRSNAPCRL